MAGVPYCPASVAAGALFDEGEDAPVSDLEMFSGLRRQVD
jgi:hypothetical protein